ncbi:hypothetical protein HQ865_10245 [Mucilaginibacter mali]|uniref:Uncharacterized protein n=1 Tax=Mucilaginibacter mali TaxID=2740462 RepID=A0A7D4PU45_9SPHI|nr:hypothetical protein [Mucilaginibacter mali]QKJ30123.1 hypothetical protein HQ865_10245 [Mucilaginibacter mali]
MKKFIIILGIVLTSGIAALALSNKKAPETIVSRVNIDKNELSAAKAQVNNTVKDNLTNAD